MKKSTKFTIVTVCYNAVRDIEKTIQSVLSQKYLNLEYIVIDGNSTDGTVEIIDKYSSKITTWISEPDKGIYDAMNKGINLATGDYINFMNAGDTFYDDNVLCKIASLDLLEDVVYGDAIMITELYTFHQVPKSLSLFKKTLPFCHQSSFTKAKLLKQFKFDLSYTSAADYNLMYQLWIRNFDFRYIPIEVSIFDARDGFSATHKKKVYKEIGRITGTNKSWIGRVGIYTSYYIYTIRRIIKNMIPKSLLRKIMAKNIHNYKNYSLR